MDERAEVRAGLRVDDPMVIFIRCRVPQRGMRTHIRCSSIRTRSAWSSSARAMAAGSVILMRGSIAEVCRARASASGGTTLASSVTFSTPSTNVASGSSPRSTRTLTSAQDRAEAGRGGWRAGVPSPQGRGPASLLRDDCAPRLQPLAGAGPARRHRLGRLARSRAATRGLGLRGLAARVFGPPGEPPSEALASERGDFVGSRLELHDGDEPNGPLRVEHRVDAFNTWRIWARSPSTFVPEAWVSTIRPDSSSSSCARWTSRRTETPAPIGIAWISAVAFMGLGGEGPHLVSGCLNRSLSRRCQPA